MQIIHNIDAFLFTIFPNLKSDFNSSDIKAVLEKYYSYGPFKPKVTIDNRQVIIEIDTSTIISQDSDYRKTVALCEKGKYAEAKPILKELIKKNPTNSEYHRIMGQILSDEGDQEEAINCLIDALRWDSKNGWALLLMANIFAKFKKDFTTAMKYYDQALIANPKDNITINNIAVNLMQQGKLEEAKKYFWEALKINDKYPNTHFGLSLLAEKQDDLHSAFYNIIEAIKLNKNQDKLYSDSVKHAFYLSKKIIETQEAKLIYNEYRYNLELRGRTEIDIIADLEIPTAAKIEFAENHNRSKHVVKYKSSYPAVEHLIMHELAHLDFAIEARKKGLNQLFISTQEHKSEFLKTVKSEVATFKKLGISENSIANYFSALFDGINNQVFNSPIDLFIENFLFNEYPDLRPYQFLSLYGLIQDGIKAVTDKKVLELAPKNILLKSKIYNLVTALQYKDLFGIDLTNEFQASASEIRHANEFYTEYLEYKDDKEPGEEYELLLHWAEDLNLDKNFELIDEVEYRTKRTDLDNLIASIESDPFDLESKDPYKEKQTEKFLKSEQSNGTNMAVVMFMVDAMQYFERMTTDEIKKIAFEIAMQGTQGYHVDQDGYIVPSIRGKTFSGYHILAYYYVSWMLTLPEMVPQLNLPYDEEFKLAKTIFKPKS
jgi:tetratricopeptide (TPR) repeat protein